MLGEHFLTWCLSLQLALFISRVCGHRWSKNMRSTAANVRPPALCGMSTQGQLRTLFYNTPHNFYHIVRFELRHRTMDGGRSWTPAECVAASQMIAELFRKRLAECSLPATTACRARRVLFGLDKFVRINAYVAKGTACMHHTLLCKNFERKWFYGSC